MQLESRRSFIRRSSAAVGTAVLGFPAVGRAIGANEKLGACVIGVNGRGASHIEAWVKDNRTEIRAIVDVDEVVGNKRCDQIEARQGLRPVLLTDMRKAFDSDDIDVVSIATPNHWHALSSIWAMQAGKDVYVEKPVCHNVHEGAAMIAAARKYNRMCQVGTQCRSSQACIDAIRFLQDGGIGECKFARGLCYKRRPSIGPRGDYRIPDNVNFDLWSGPAPLTSPILTRKNFHYDWHWQRDYGNGDLGNQGPHQTDVARWGLGIDAHPTSVITYGGRLGYQAELKNDNYVDAGDTANTEVTIYDYGNKCIVFETRGLSVDKSDDPELNRLFSETKGNKVGVVWYGTEGYLVQSTYYHCIAYDKEMNVIKEFRGGNLQDHYANFLDAVVSRDYQDLNADIRQGHLSAAMSHLGNISYYMGENNTVDVKEISRVLGSMRSLDNNEITLHRTVNHLTQNGVDLSKYPLSLGTLLAFDPQTERFINNAAADVWLTREYRKPYVCPSVADV